MVAVMEEPDLFGATPSLVEHRTYFALYPPPDIAVRIERYARDLARGQFARRIVAAARLHISLNGLQRGQQLAPEETEEALMIGEAVRRPPFDLVFDRVQTWDGGREQARRGPAPTVLCCSDLPREALALYEDLRRRMQEAGMRTGRSAFNPHITLFYAPGRLPTRTLPRPLRLHIDRFCLVHTATGTMRPDYLASWPLKL